MTDIAPDDMAQEVQDKWYGDHDYHTMYIGEIVAAKCAVLSRKIDFCRKTRVLLT